MLADRLHHDRGLGNTQPTAAVFHGHGDAEPAVVRHLADEFIGEAVLALRVHPVLLAEFVTDFLHRVADRPLIWGEGKTGVIHGASSKAP